MRASIRFEGPRDLTRQLYLQLRAAILEGRMKRGERLLPSRDLALQLNVSRNTVGLAYEWLIAEGLVTGRRGAGTYVASQPLPRTARGEPAATLPVPRATRGEPAATLPVPRATRGEEAAIRRRAAWEAIPLPLTRDSAPFDFRVGIPDVSLFPFDTWRRLVARQIRRTALEAEAGDSGGDSRLRVALARHISSHRGVRAEAEDVILTNGAQGAFDLIARVLLEPGALVAVEDPGYPPASLLFQAYGARVEAVPVDAEGLHVARLPAGVRLVYVTPAHQFPLGMPMSPARKIALLEWAERRNAVVVEDDYDSEVCFGERPLETLQAIDRNGRVIHVGSFSTLMLPSLRLGYLVTPPSLRPALRAASHLTGGSVQWPAHAALAAFIEKGLLARHAHRMRRACAARRERILRTLERDFAEWLIALPSVAGLHLTARIASGNRRLESQVADAASRQGVRFDRLSPHYRVSGPSQAGVLLGYGGIPEGKIDEGLRRLRRCFAGAG